MCDKNNLEKWLMICFCEIAAVETLSCKQEAWNFIKI